MTSALWGFRSSSVRMIPARTPRSIQSMLDGIVVVVVWAILCFWYLFVLTQPCRGSVRPSVYLPTTTWRVQGEFQLLRPPFLVPFLPPFTLLLSFMFFFHTSPPPVLAQLYMFLPFSYSHSLWLTFLVPFLLLTPLLFSLLLSPSLPLSFLCLKNGRLGETITYIYLSVLCSVVAIVYYMSVNIPFWTLLWWAILFLCTVFMTFCCQVRLMDGQGRRLEYEYHSANYQVLTEALIGLRNALGLLIKVLHSQHMHTANFPFYTSPRKTQIV